MRFGNVLDDLLAQKSKIKILRLFLNTGIEATGRELAKNISMDHKTCSRALRELSERGIVLINHTGKGTLYKINPRSVLVKELLIPLFDKEKRILQIMAKSLVKRINSPYVSILLFGSSITGGERPSSDIDVFIVTPGWKDKEKIENSLAEIGFDFVCEFGSRLSPLVLSQEELRLKLGKKDPLIIEIVREGELIAGKPIKGRIKFGR